MADKKIYTVATSHLDTVWSWDFETTVSKYIYNTLVDNFKLFENILHINSHLKAHTDMSLWRNIIPNFLKK